MAYKLNRFAFRRDLNRPGQDCRALFERVLLTVDGELVDLVAAHALDELAGYPVKQGVQERGDIIDVMLKLLYRSSSP